MGSRDDRRPTTTATSVAQLKFAAETRHALMHPHEAQLPMLGQDCQGLIRLAQAPSVILDHQGRAAFGVPENDIHYPYTGGMLGDVGQRLLQDPEKGSLVALVERE